MHIKEKLFINVLPEKTPKSSRLLFDNGKSKYDTNLFNHGMSLNGIKLNDHVVALSPVK